MTSGRKETIGGGPRSFPPHGLVPEAEQMDLYRLTLKICSMCSSLDLTFLSFKRKTKNFENVTAQREHVAPFKKGQQKRAAVKVTDFYQLVRKGHLPLVLHKRMWSRRVCQ